MRTTLNIDDEVLEIAKARSEVNRTSVGEEVSRMALASLNRPSRVTIGDDGWPIISMPEGHVITNEMVWDALDED